MSENSPPEQENTGCATQKDSCEGPAEKGETRKKENISTTMGVLSMNQHNQCHCGTARNEPSSASHEDVRIEGAKNICGLCESYADRHQAKPIAVLCCEGACLRGEIARQAANILCHTLAPERTVRICLGGAFTKNTGQRNLVRSAPRVIALEGCPVNCSSRMMQGVIPGLTPEVVVADHLYDFDRTLFSIEEMSPEETRSHAHTVATTIAATL